MEVRLEEVKTEDIAEINRIQTLAFKESYEKYGFCSAFEATDEDVIAYLENADVYKIIVNDIIIGSETVICMNNMNIRK